MKIALCVIAKNEDNYIDEWIEYNFKIGFTDIFIAQNDWRYKGKYINDCHIHLKNYDGPTATQLGSWNDFIQTEYMNYDWVAFFDVDEFLGIKSHEKLDTFLSKYAEYDAIQFHWRFFGDNGHTKIVDNNYSCINRFLRSAKYINNTIKSIINLKKIKIILK